jgi:hypothetical protein
MRWAQRSVAEAAQQHHYHDAAQRSKNTFLHTQLNPNSLGASINDSSIQSEFT